MGSVYRWQEGVLEGRKKDEMAFDSLGYNHTDQEVRTIPPNRSPLKGKGCAGLSKKLITLPFINH